MTKSLLFLVILIGLLAACLSATFAQFGGSPLSPEQAKEFEKLTKDGFYELEAELGEKLILNDDDNVTKISLEKFNEDTRLVEKGENALSAVTTEAIHLAAVKRALDQDALLRPFAPPGSGFGYGGSYLMGTLRIQTAKRTIVVRVIPAGFAFGEDSRGLAQRVFYSWTLAKVLDDMIAKATDGKQRLSQRLFATLSGEAVVERNKRIYWAAAEAQSGSGK